MGGVVSGIGSIAGPIIGGLFQQGPSGSSPAGSFLGGLATSQMNKPQGQTQPGAFEPQGGQGLAYNYIPAGQAGVDTGYLNQLGYNTATGQGGQALADPMLATLLRNIMNDPTMGQAGAAAQRAGTLSGQAGQGAFGAGGALQQGILGALPQFQQILRQGTDPQGALYDRTLAQTRDQMGAGLAQQGLTGSGVGAAIENQGISNFNIDWQNQQLARALSAMQGFGGAMGQAGQGLQAGAGLQQTGIQEALGAGQIPWQQSQNIFGGQQKGLNDFLTSMGTGQNLGNQNLSQMLSYLQAGQNANQLAQAQALGGLGNVQAQNAAASAGLSPLISAGLTGIGNQLGPLLSQIFGSGSSDNSLFGGGYSGGLGAGTTSSGADY